MIFGSHRIVSYQSSFLHIGRIHAHACKSSCKKLKAKQSCKIFGAITALHYSRSGRRDLGCACVRNCSYCKYQSTILTIKSIWVVLKYTNTGCIFTHSHVTQISKFLFTNGVRPLSIHDGVNTNSGYTSTQTM
jgi:hypothetical protein